MSFTLSWSFDRVWINLFMNRFIDLSHSPFHTLSNELAARFRVNLAAISFDRVWNGECDTSCVEWRV